MVPENEENDDLGMASSWPRVSRPCSWPIAIRSASCRTTRPSLQSFAAICFGQGQLDRPLGLQVDDDGGSMGFPFLGGFPGNDRLKGSKPVAQGVEPGGLDSFLSLRAGRLEGVPAVRFGLYFGRHRTL